MSGNVYVGVCVLVCVSWCVSWSVCANVYMAIRISIPLVWNVFYIGMVVSDARVLSGMYINNMLLLLLTQKMTLSLFVEQITIINDLL